MESAEGCLFMDALLVPDLSVLNLVIVKNGDNDLPGFTDIEKPRMRGPKRASKIRKLFNLSKEDDVRKYVNTYRQTFATKNGKNVSKAPKIQKEEWIKFFVLFYSFVAVDVLSVNDNSNFNFL
ncbi:40S ribosomal protein S6-1 [Abeliophyllum distichum]|uniref:40S ribosomal protein S6-1 n=1 Tax=Abeliophyllum distichum TaxID=126358 RepID=A0ABD1V5U3_9LAMI